MDRKFHFCWGVALFISFGAELNANAGFSFSGNNPPIIVHADFTDASRGGDLPAALSISPDMHEPTVLPAAYWKLNGSLANAVSGGPAFQPVGSPTFNSAATGLELGKFHDGSLHLNGVSQYLTASGGDPVFTRGSGSFAVSLWYAPSSRVTGKQVLISKGSLDGGEPGFELYLERAADDTYIGARIAVASTPGGSVTGAASCIFKNLLPNKEWHHLLVVFQRGSSPSIQIFVNGDLVANEGGTAAISVATANMLPADATADNAGDLMIGASQGPSGVQNFFKGHVDEVKFFDAALTNKDANLACRTPQSLYAGDYACGWLQEYIEKLTGIKPEIYAENYPGIANHTGPIISVGHTEMAANQSIVPTAKQSIVQTDGSGNTAKVFVIGHDSFGPREDDPDWNPLSPRDAATNGWFSGSKGTNKAVTMLLEQFGVKWFAPGTKGMAVPEQSATNSYTAVNASYIAPYDYILGTNFRIIPPNHIFRYASGMIESKKVKSYYSHTWKRWVPASEYGPPAHVGVMYDDHCRDPSGHLCTTSSTARNALIDAIAGHFNAGYEFVELGQTDGWKSCECTTCVAAFDTPTPRSFTINGVSYTRDLKDFDEVKNNGSVTFYEGSRWPLGVVLADPLDPDGSVYDRFKRNPCRRIHVFHREVVQGLDDDLFSASSNRKVLLSAYQIAWAPPWDEESYPSDRIVVQHTRRPYAEGVGLWNGKASGVGLYGYYWGNWKSSGSLPKSSPKMLLNDFKLIMANTGATDVKGMQFNGQNDDWPLEGPVYYVAHALTQESNPASWNDATLANKVREYCDLAYGDSTVGGHMAQFFEELYARIDSSYVQAWKPENKNPRWYFTNAFKPSDIQVLDPLLNAAVSATPDPMATMMYATKLNYDLLRAFVLMFQAQAEYEAAVNGQGMASVLIPKLNAWESAVNTYNAAKAALTALANPDSVQYRTYQSEWYRGSGLAYNYLTDPERTAAYVPPTAQDFAEARAFAESQTVVSSWKFDGNFQDDRGDNNLDFGSNNTDNTFSFDGSVGWAKDFDGTNDYLVSDSSPSHLNFGVASFSVSCWVLFPDAGNFTNQTIIMLGDSFNSLKLYRAANNTPRADITVNGTTYTCESDPTATFDADVFQHLCFAVDRSGSLPSLRLFLDGEEVNTVASASVLANNSIPISPTISPIFVGASKNGSNQPHEFLKGQIDRLRIDEVAFTEDDIEAFMSGDAAPLSRWTFDGNGNDEYGDNHATLQGAVTYTLDALGGNAVVMTGTGTGKATVVAAPTPPPNAPVLSQLSVGDFTVSLRFKPNTLSPDYSNLFTLGGSQSFDIRIGNPTPGHARVRLTTQLGVPGVQEGIKKVSTFTQDVPITMGSWNYLTVSVTRGDGGSIPGSMKLYWSGVFLDKTIGNNRAANSDIHPFQTQPLMIGGASTNSYFDGAIDDVRIYPRALTSEEISGIYFPTP